MTTYKDTEVTINDIEKIVTLTYSHEKNNDSSWTYSFLQGFDFSDFLEEGELEEFKALDFWREQDKISKIAGKIADGINRVENENNDLGVNFYAALEDLLNEFQGKGYELFIENDPYDNPVEVVTSQDVIDYTFNN